MRKRVLKISGVAFILYGAFLCVLYFVQERLIFFPRKLDKTYRFDFKQAFEELSFPMEDHAILNGILFRADTPKGLIFYLHGNAGSLKTWGAIAKTYTDLQYDLFMPDYRGYGKSEGTISSQEQLYRDVQAMYDELKMRYAQNSIVIIGYSIGTGPAAKLASENRAGLLVLQAPYYSLASLMRRYYPLVPGFLLKYKFETNQYIRACKMPVAVFHGDEDEVIDYRSSIQLKALFKQSDTLIILKGQRHNGMSDHPEYAAALTSILTRLDNPQRQHD